jgi:soluble lytic murein transglycosylase-like protein
MMTALALSGHDCLFAEETVLNANTALTNTTLVNTTLVNTTLVNKKLIEELYSSADAEQAEALSDFEAKVKNVAAQTQVAEKERKKQERLKSAEKKTRSAHFKFFKYRKDGAVAYSDKKPKKTEFQVIVFNSCYACSPLSKVNWRATRLYKTEFADAIALAANRYAVDPALVRAIIHAESNFNPLVRSHKGAMGLMQLMPKTAIAMGVSDAYNSGENIDGGTKYLSLMLEKFNGNVSLAAAAYNAGPNAVSKYNGVPPYQETKTYVERVKILHNRYKNELALARN